MAISLEEAYKSNPEEFANMYPATYGMMSAYGQFSPEVIESAFLAEQQRNAQIQQSVEGEKKAAEAEEVRRLEEQAVAVKLSQDLAEAETKARGRYQSRNDLRESGIDPLAMRHQQIATADQNRRAVNFNADSAALQKDVDKFNNVTKLGVDNEVANYNATYDWLQRDPGNSGLATWLNANRGRIDGLIASTNKEATDLQGRVDALDSRRSEFGLINQKIENQQRRDAQAAKRDVLAKQSEVEMAAKQSGGQNANRGGSGVFNQQEQSVFDEIKSWLGSGPR